MRKLLSGLLVLVFASPLVNATTLIAFRDSDSVVLAADSKLLPINSTAQPSSKSKIIRCGKYFVAAAGIDYPTAANIRFDVQQIITSACKPQQTPVQAMNAIRRRLDTQYVRVLDALALVQPSYVRALAVAKEKELAENLILVGSHNGVPFILTHDLVPYLERGKVSVKASGSMHNNRLKKGVVEFAFGGVYADVRALVNNQTEDLPTSVLTWTARYLVGYQISKRPDASGYPIEVVEITATGKVNWLSCDPQCAEKPLVWGGPSKRSNESDHYKPQFINKAWFHCNLSLKTMPLKLEVRPSGQ